MDRSEAVDTPAAKGVIQRRKRTGRRRPGSNDLPVQLLTESQAMARYALASGLRVPVTVLQSLERAGSLMAREQGLDLATSDAAIDWPELVRTLAQVHDQLAQIVAPATPRTLLLLSRERQNAGFWRFLGAVRLVRQMMTAAVLLLLVFAITALSPDVNRTSGDIFNSSGMRLLVNEIFLLSAAGVGAAFAALFTANRYVANGTYDPKYESSYWVRFLLGIIAGIVLATLVPMGPDSQAFTRPLLALLGGFSASVVYRILDRLVNTLETLVHDVGDVAAAREQSVRATVAEQKAEDQLRLGAALVRVREQVSSGAQSEEVLASMNRILDEILPGGLPEASSLVEPNGSSPSGRADIAADDRGHAPAAPV